LGGKSAFDIAPQRLILAVQRKLTYVPACVTSAAYELGLEDRATSAACSSAIQG
jgi:AraC family transcriptional activator of pobA